MKLHYSTTSPYVRKVMVSAIELGLDGEIEKELAQGVNPIRRTTPVIADNPLGKIPALIARDGSALHDSRVICEYLDFLAGGGRLFPVAGPARWRALTDQSLADGMTDAALLLRYETALRPAELVWRDWCEGQLGKVTSSLERFEAIAPDLAGRLDIGTISIGCALGYLDYRFDDFGWRQRFPRLASWLAVFGKRPSMTTTAIPSGT